MSKSNSGSGSGVTSPQQGRTPSDSPSKTWAGGTSSSRGSHGNLSTTVDNSGNVIVDEFRRTGIVMMAKSDLDGSEVLCSGCLLVRSATLGMGPVLSWVPDELNNETRVRKTSVSGSGGSSGVVCGSLNDREWTVVSSDVTHSARSTSGVALGQSSQSGRITVRPIVVEVNEIKSFRLSDDGNQMVIIQSDGTKCPPLIFLDEGPEALIQVFQKYMKVRRSVTDDNLYLLTDARIDALDASLSQLNLFDKSNTDAMWKLISDIKKDPYTTTMSVFSKITDRLIFSPLDEEVRPEEEMADLLQKSFFQGGSGAGQLHVTTGHREDGEFEVVIPRVKLLDTNGALNDSIKCKPRSEPLCQLDWELHFDESGRIQELDDLKEKIFRGGVEHEIREEVWKFLLDFYPWVSDARQRQELRNRKVEEYHKMKLQWRTISEDQENRFSAFRERKSQIEKDVGRTDRNHPFFAGDNNDNVKLLEEILMTYVMYNFDLGYVQGMSDLLAPILFVMGGNEVDAFWCFVGFMKRVSHNFDFDQGGIKRQLAELSSLIKLIDPDFFAYLDTRDSGNFFFCFRWLLIWFKRELAFSDVMRLWEVLWTDAPCKNFHLLICAALINDQAAATIVENKFGFSEILKHINDLANRIELNDVLMKAEYIYLKIKEVSNQSAPLNDASSERIHVNATVRSILGLPAPLSTGPQAADGEGATPPYHNPETSPRHTTSSSSRNNRPASVASIEVIEDGATLAPAASSREVDESSKSVGRNRSLPIPVGSRAAKRDCSDLNESSSVEVLSPLDADEERFQHSLSNFY